MINQLNDFVLSTNCNETVASLIRKTAENQLSKKSPIQNCYNLTDLCNPAQTYCFKINTEVQKTADTQRILDRGTQLHKFACVWFKTLPGFMVSEGVLDGAMVKINRIKGRIDFMIENEIIEFKTKDILPRNPEEILQLYPQDIEQLAFYSAIHPSSPKINYLVFMANFPPFELKAFKIMIKDIGKIKSLLISRRNALDKALKENNPSLLGQCRYRESCKFKDSESCFCKNLQPISTKIIKDAVEITPDEDFTNKLEKTRKQCKRVNSIVAIKDIIAPRKYYMENVLKLKSSWIPDKEKDNYKAYLGSLVQQVSNKISCSERQDIFKLSREPRLNIAYKWIKIKSSADPSGYEILPYTIKVNNYSKKEYTLYPAPYNLAELGIISAVHEKTKGFIFTIYPKLDDFIQVFQVNYKEIDHIFRKVKDSIDNIEKAKIDKNLLSLPKCPEFMNDKKTCPLIKECHVEKGKGCIPNYIYPVTMIKNPATQTQNSAS